jgi:hypothetical protein
MYDGILRTADIPSSVKLASRLLTMNAPASVKADAQATIDRANLIGKQSELALMTLDQTPIALSDPKAKTVLYVWTNRVSTEELETLSLLNSEIPAGTRLICISLQSNLKTAAEAVSKAPVQAQCSFETPGFDGLTARTLKVQQLPCVYVLDTQGNIVGYGAPADLPSLLNN